VAILPTTSADITVTTAYAGPVYYTKSLSGKTYEAGNGYNASWKMTRIIDLASVTADITAIDGDKIKGTLASDHKISIANGATVTLDGVTINGTSDVDYMWAGLTCEGNATIILKDDTTNTVKGFYANYPGIYVPKDKTLTIQGETAGTGSLAASSNGYGAGIGCSYSGGKCGNITIKGGFITATGGNECAGIGSSSSSSCGDITISGGQVMATGGEQAAGIGSGHGSSSSCGKITISGGTITATGGQQAAGIGSGRSSSCGTITIASSVTSVTATMGSDAPNSIGAGEGGTCGTVTIEDGANVTQK
jgi:hypothetical protein